MNVVERHRELHSTVVTAFPALSCRRKFFNICEIIKESTLSELIVIHVEVSQCGRNINKPQTRIKESLKVFTRIVFVSLKSMYVCEIPVDDDECGKLKAVSDRLDFTLTF